MAYTLSITDLRAEIRQEGVDENPFPDTKLDRWIKRSFTKLYDLIAKHNPDALVTVDDSTVATVSGTDSYSLPSDFYRLRAIDVQDSDGDWFPLGRAQIGARDRLNGTGSYRRWWKYRLMGSATLYIFPTPSAAAQLRIWYVPSPPDITATDFNFEAGWHTYLVAHVMVQWCAATESDPSTWAAIVEDERGRIEAMASDLDDAEPDQVRDVAQERSDPAFPDYWNP